MQSTFPKSGEPDTIQISKYGEDSALQCLQVIDRKWFNRFHSRDLQIYGDKREIYIGKEFKY